MSKIGFFWHSVATRLWLMGGLGVQGLVWAQGTAVRPGAAQFAEYVPYLQGKAIGVVVHAASVVEGRPLVDTLLAQGLDIRRLFTPEHGLYGQWDAGQAVADQQYRDIAVVSLYGAKKKPHPDDLADLDALVFDLQDVGVRFYTYISTLHYVLAAAADAEVPVWVLDRPNPNADYIDGPIMEDAYRSFVGMHPIPVVYGMTIGELAQMIVGESWLATQKTCSLSVVRITQWTRTTPYMPEVAPSPNLRTYSAIRWYPTLGLFEGTVMSVGRGTDIPFEAVGYPDAQVGEWVFRPAAVIGASRPKYADQDCYGRAFVHTPPPAYIDLQWLKHFYAKIPQEVAFFTPYFTKLVGNRSLQAALQADTPMGRLRAQWDEALNAFKQKRSKYLLYPDN